MSSVDVTVFCSVRLLKDSNFESETLIAIRPGSIHFLVYYHGWIWFLAPEVGVVEEHQGPLGPSRPGSCTMTVL